MNKLSLLTIHTDEPFSLASVLARLGMEIHPQATAHFGEVLWPSDAWIGIHAHAVFITCRNLEGFFFEPDAFTKAVLALFPTSRIAATFYYSVADQLGFAYFENGERIRAWYGIGDEKVLVNDGLPLAIEVEEPTQDPDSEIEYQLIKLVTGSSFTDLLRQEIVMHKIIRNRTC